MLPLLPYSSLTRPPRFVAEEWNTYFNTTSPTPAQHVQGGWKGILYANLALVDPKAAWRFFSQSEFDPGWIDGGASRTWYLAWCAGEWLIFPFWVGVDVERERRGGGRGWAFADLGVAGLGGAS